MALGCGAAGCLMAVPWFPTLWGGVALALAALVAVLADALFELNALEREADAAAQLAARLAALEALAARHESMIESLNRKQAIQAIR